MSLNPQYIWLPVLQQNFVDKDSDEPLSNGYILFFDDDQRTIGKKVFMLSGSPPNYVYFEYGFFDGNGAWRVNLLQDGALGNALYFFPYDANGNVENYFVQVYSAGNVLQFSLEAIPNLPAGGGGNVVTTNFVANPQFAINYPPNPTVGPPATIEGQINQAITPIAPGGWTFERTNMSSATDIVLFPTIGYGTSPPQNPKFAVNIACTVPSGTDTVKDLRLKYFNVNKFASTTQQYTFGFFGLSSSSLTVQLYLIKFFGTVGSPSPTTTTLLHTFTLGNTYTNQSFSFLFPANTGTTLGTNNDDYLQLALRFPPTTSFNATLTDFVLTLGAISAPILPDLPDDIYFTDSLAGYYPRPNPNGTDLYLKLINTPTGFAFDKSEIGQIITSIQTTAPLGYLPLDGTTYKTADANPLTGIPYSRIQSYLIAAIPANTTNIPIWGTGSTFVTEVLLTQATLNTITHYTNIAGAVAVPVDGGVPTGFTFANLNGTVNSHIQANAVYAGSHIVYVQNITEGLQLIAQFDNGGSVLPAHDGGAGGAGGTGFAINVLTYGDHVRQQFEIQCTAGSAITGGHYFWYKTPTNSFYVWYKVNGAGGDPSPAGFDFGIKVDILSTFSSDDVARSTAYAINGFQVANITTVAASAIPQSAYFRFVTVAPKNFYVWYNKAGGGTDPMIGSSTGIMVALTGTETNAQVALATLQAVNNTYFALINAQGATLMQLDTSGGGGNGIFDPDNIRRWMFNGYYGGALLGSFEFDSNQQHGHNIYTGAGAGPITGPIDTVNYTPANINFLGDIDTTQLAIQGGKTARPYNMAVNYFIKY